MATTNRRITKPLFPERNSIETPIPKLDYIEAAKESRLETRRPLKLTFMPEGSQQEEEEIPTPKTLRTIRSENKKNQNKGKKEDRVYDCKGRAGSLKLPPIIRKNEWWTNQCPDAYIDRFSTRKQTYANLNSFEHIDQRKLLEDLKDEPPIARVREILIGDVCDPLRIHYKRKGITKPIPGHTYMNEFSNE